MTAKENSARMLAAARELAARRFLGIDEKEALAYASGFTRGLLAAGLSRPDAERVVLGAMRGDKKLEAGGAYYGIAMAEAEISSRQ